MLVLRRVRGEVIDIGGIKLRVLRITEGRVILGFDNPMDVPIIRKELLAEEHGCFRRQLRANDMGLFVVGRKANESVIIGTSITLMVLAIEWERVKLGFAAPPEVMIVRQELLDMARPV